MDLIEILPAVVQDDLADDIPREFAANTPPAPLHVFHHLPKCGGTTLK